MKAIVEDGLNRFTIDLSAPIDISIPLSPYGPRAWYVEPMRIAPVINRFFRGSVKLGGSVNFNDIAFNPHGHGTHTETYGHVSKELISVHEVVQQFHHFVQLVTITPEIAGDEAAWIKKGDRIIRKSQLENVMEQFGKALIVRTLPNNSSKLSSNYSNTNFPFFEPEALAWLAEKGIEHLLVDLPSVDREEDGGLLLAHRAYWQNGAQERMHATITEFVFVPESVADGNYFINLQIAPFVNDASPSRILLFKLNT